MGCLAEYNSGNTYEDSPAHYRVAHDQRAAALDLGKIPVKFLAEVSDAWDRDINTVLWSEKCVQTYVKDVCSLLAIASEAATSRQL
ncbi:hypothetical protein ACRE_054160 [Hapsidospora chrysogenum ATCC 11550]|uniref:Uncharacterized protein n=1 Tax=Hapsidospora chrysogenum (strain ATCC 11550 / CBS 779.69 / DSM 880 / IAM 14645 / JCM 23072 / IMI 49137) TaxID=857340 RepID=A0A086T395_HAPC1|nr:hypothetical protein ACRE_054160 [Hapsidospora chrysogenum ATCC 11550]